MRTEHKFTTDAERQAYYKGFTDGGIEATERPDGYVVVFERNTYSDEIAATAGLMRSIRGVVAVLPVAETFSGHMAWRELVEVLGADPSDDHAQEYALTLASGRQKLNAEANAIYHALFNIATPEQREAILASIREARGEK